MFKNLLFKVFNVTVCMVTLQASLDTVDYEYLKLLPRINTSGPRRVQSFREKWIRKIYNVQYNNL